MLTNGSVNISYRPLVLSMYHQFICKLTLTAEFEKKAPVIEIDIIYIYYLNVM